MLLDAKLYINIVLGLADDPEIRRLSWILRRLGARTGSNANPEFGFAQECAGHTRTELLDKV